MSIYLSKILLLILLLPGLLLPLEVLAEDNIQPRPSIESNLRQSEEIEIRIYDGKIINDNFYGFGVETLPWLWTRENKEAGVRQEDIELNLERIRTMRLPFTRIFVPWETWNPSVDYKTFTWESDEMRSLYKTLDLYQEMGTKVILVTVDWLKDSPWKNIKQSSRAVLILLKYLIKDRGYSCIQFWTLTNEPELTYGWLERMPFKNYIQIHRLVKRGLKKRGLSVKIIASDEVECQDWFEKSVRHLVEVADIFSSHAYFYPQHIHLISDFFSERIDFIKTASYTKREIPFFLCEFGFRGSNFGSCTNSLIEDYEYGLYVANLCIEVLNRGVDAASLWCLHQIRLIDEIRPEGKKLMRIGLWAFKDKDWQAFPIFYLYQLFTKYVRGGSRVLAVNSSSEDALKVACVEYKGQYSLFILNMSNNMQSFIVKGLPKGLKIKKYIYMESYPTSEHAMGEDNTNTKVKNYLKDKIPPFAVFVLTTLLDDYL